MKSATHFHSGRQALLLSALLNILLLPTVGHAQVSNGDIVGDGF